MSRVVNEVVLAAEGGWTDYIPLLWQALGETIYMVTFAAMLTFVLGLLIGITASLFTSIVVTRVITTYLVHGRNAQTVSI